MSSHPLPQPLRLARWSAAALSALALAAFIAYSLIYLRYAVALFQFPFDYDRGEGFELNGALLFSRGQWPYQDNNLYPFYGSAYPPLFHLIVAPLVWVFGPQYWTGRLVSFAATLVTAGAIGWAVKRETGQRSVAALSGLAFLASNYVYHIGPLFRQHMTMVMFETLAVVVLACARAEASKRISRREILGLAFLLAAGYTKPLAYVTVAAGFVYLFLRHPRRAFLEAIGFGAAAAGLFAALNLATAGQWWVNVVLANVNKFVPGQALGLFRQWYQLHAILIWLAGVWVLFQLYGAIANLWRRSSNADLPAPRPRIQSFRGSQVSSDRWRVSRPGEKAITVAATDKVRDRLSLSVYSIWAVAAVANGVTAGKWGAGEAYFTTSVAAICICSGLALGKLAQSSARWRPAAALAVALAIPLLYLAQAVRLVHLPTTGRAFGLIADTLGIQSDSGYYDSQGYTQLGRPPNAIDIAQGEKILAFVRAAPGPVLSEEAAFPILAGKDVVTDPTHLLNLYENGLYDPANLVAMIRAREFGGVVLNAQFYPLPILQALGQAYRPVGEVQMNGFTYHLLTPRAP